MILLCELCGLNVCRNAAQLASELESQVFNRRGHRGESQGGGTCCGGLGLLCVLCELCGLIDFRNAAQPDNKPSLPTFSADSADAVCVRGRYGEFRLRRITDITVPVRRL